MPVDDLNYPEVDFSTTGLKTVVCQLRYDMLLRIAHEPPIAIQEALLPVFSKLEQRTEQALIEFRVSAGGSERGGFLPSAEGIQSDPVVSLFRTEDEQWTVSLGSRSFSIETTAYVNFAQFQEKFELAYQAFRESYPVIERFTRVGLRYINMFEVDKFPNGGWGSRFRPPLLGPSTDDDIGSSVASVQQKFVLAEDDWTITVRHGSDPGGDYLLDLDHASTAGVEANRPSELLSEFNRRLYQVFRWCITEEMFNELGPEPRQ